MFVIGGVGLVIGLATYGYKIMRVLGVKVTRISNSRGYCAELTSAIIVIIASRYGFPVSTTQVITGAITGIGLQEVITARIKGLKSPAKRFNFLLLLKFFAGWVATLVVAGLTAAAFTAQGIYSPNKFVAEWRTDFNSAFNTTNVGISKTLIAAGNTTSPSPAEQQALLWGQEIANATKLTWQTNNMSMLNPSVVLATFQIGSWYLGNTTLVGVLTNTYMPIMPLEGLPTGGIE
jgi:sodium-dependent phosphate transporter